MAAIADISDYLPTILSMRAEGKPITEVYRHLVQVGYSKSYQTLRRHVVKVLSGDPLSTQRRRRMCRSREDDRIIRETVEKAYLSNSSTSAIMVQSQLANMGITISDRQIRRIRRELGFERRTVKYCQLIREANKVKRLEFCSQMIAAMETFSDCIFTDESTIQVDGNLRRCFSRDNDNNSRLRPRAKHPAKIH